MAKNEETELRKALGPANQAVLSIGVFLRSVAPGFIVVFAMILVDKRSLDVVTGANEGYPEWVMLSGVILTGFLIHAVHSTVVVRPLWWLVVTFHRRAMENPLIDEYYKKRNEKVRGKSTWKIMSDIDKERWKRRASQEQVVKGFQDELDNWGALQNLLYTSSYIMTAVPLCLQLVSPQHMRESWPVVVGLGVFLFVVSLISEYRETNVEFWASVEYFDGISTRNNSR